MLPAPVPGVRLGHTILACWLAIAVIAENSYSSCTITGQRTRIACFDQTMRAGFQYLREQCRPEEPLLFSSAYYQHVRCFLPEYRTWFWDPAR